MTTERTQILYCPEHVCWIVEQKDLLLINRKTGSRQRLPYPNAAVWDLLSRNTPLDRLLTMLGTVAALSAEEAGKLVEKCLQDWLTNGWLETGK